MLMNISEAPSEDPRCAPRLNLTLEVTLTSPHGSLSAYSADISSTGLFVETVDLIPVGTKVEVEFSLPGTHGRKTVRAKGRVVRHATIADCQARGIPPGLGIRFEELVLGEESLQLLIEGGLAKLQVPPPSRSQASVLKSVPSSRPARPVSTAHSAQASSVNRPARREPLTTSAPPPSSDKTDSGRAASFAAGLPVFWGEVRELDHKDLLVGLSSSGAFIETRRPAKPGTLLRLWFELPLSGRPKPIDVAARVVCATDGSGDQPAGMGITFEDPDTEHENICLFAIGRLYHQVALEKEAWRYRIKEPTRVESSTAFEPRDRVGSWGRTLWLAAKLGAVLFALYVLAFVFMLTFGRL